MTNLENLREWIRMNNLTENEMMSMVMQLEDKIDDYQKRIRVIQEELSKKRLRNPDKLDEFAIYD